MHGRIGMIPVNIKNGKRWVHDLVAVGRRCHQKVHLLFLKAWTLSLCSSMNQSFKIGKY